MKRLRILAATAVLSTGLIGAAGAAGVTPASAAMVANCRATQLHLSVGQPSGAAGTSWYPVVFTNTGTAACAIWGVPQIQPVLGGASHSRAHVGPSARNESMGEMGVRHVVAPGKSVSDAFGVTDTLNYSAATCRPRWAGGIEVTLGDFLRHGYVALRISVCTRLASTRTQLIVAGATGD